MTRSRFPLFQSHLDLAHSYWEKIVVQGDCVIDATCGNGWDTLTLANIVLTETEGKIYAFDIQQKAIEASKALLSQHLSLEIQNRIAFILGSHTDFSMIVSPIKLIVYNLGYLPGSTKSITTETETSLKSIESGLHILQPGGAISITCYPGHPEGAREEQALLSFAATLSPQKWSCSYQRWINRQQSPSLLLIQKSL